jgi:hypothetical protein
MTHTLVYRRWAPMTVVRPSGVALVGLFVLLLGAWAGIVGYVGPVFGFNATTSSAWAWTRTNWILHLLPGAVAFVAGLLVLSQVRALFAWRWSFATAGLLAVAAGAWLVIGPVASPLFESAHVYGPSTGSLAAFANQVGAYLGPGLVLVALGGMSLKSALPERAVQVTPPAEPAAPPAPGAQPAGPVPAVPPQEQTGQVTAPWPQ